MFNIGATELILILLIAFIVVGPRDLPKIARFLGRLVRRARTIIKEIKTETGFDEVEAELDETRRDLEKTMKEADIREDLKATHRSLASLENIFLELTDKDTEERRENDG